MNDGLKDILSNLSKDVDQETLLRYLQGKLTPAQEHEVEKKLLDDEFDAAALEGLQQIKNEQHLQLMLDSLNRDIQKKTAKRKARRKKLDLKIDASVMLAVAILLLLIAVAYFIIYRHLGSG